MELFTAKYGRKPNAHSEHVGKLWHVDLRGRNAGFYWNAEPWSDTTWEDDDVVMYLGDNRFLCLTPVFEIRRVEIDLSGGLWEKWFKRAKLG